MYHQFQSVSNPSMAVNPQIRIPLPNDWMSKQQQSDYTLMKRLVPLKEIYRVDPSGSNIDGSKINSTYVCTLLVEVPEYYAVRTMPNSVQYPPMSMPSTPMSSTYPGSPSFCGWGLSPAHQNHMPSFIDEFPSVHLIANKSAPDNCNPILKGFKFEYKPCKDAIRNKRIIVCKYNNCNKEFTKSWNFLDHARMHEGLKPFVCNICGKSFTQSGNMKKHRRQHSVDDIDKRKVYKCKYCDKGYTEKFNLKVCITTRFSLEKPQ